MPLYLAKQTVTAGKDNLTAERLVEAPNKARAIGHVAQDTISVEVATPADIHRLAKDGVAIEQAE